MTECESEGILTVESGYDSNLGLGSTCSQLCYGLGYEDVGD